MSALAWFIAAVIVALLWMAFRRKRVADYVEEFDSSLSALRYTRFQDERGYDCFIQQISPERWQVRCYRRKERES